MNKMNFMLLTDGENLTWQKVSVDYDAEDYSEQFSKFIQCDWIEAVYVEIENQNYILIVDEEGLYKEDNKINIPASVWYSAMDWNYLIVGNVLIGKQGFVNGEPDIVGLSEEDFRLLKKQENYFIENMHLLKQWTPKNLL